MLILLGSPDATVLASVVAATAAVPLPTVVAGAPATVAASVVAATAAVPLPTVDAATSATVTPSTVAATVAVPLPTFVAADNVALNQATETDTALPITVGRGISVGSVSAPAVIGPFIVQGPLSPDEIDVESIPSSAVVTGPLWIANDDALPYASTITLELLEDEGEVVVAGDPLATAFNVTWFDELDGVGYGSLQMQLSETAAVAELTLHRLVRCYIGATMAFTWQIEEQPKFASVASNEEHGQVIQIKGRGWAASLDDAVVFPAIPVGETDPDFTSLFLGSERVFSFASPDYPNLGADWPNVFSHYASDVLQPFRYDHVETSEDVWEDLPAPVGWPWSDAEVYPNIIDPATGKSHWIWPTNDPYQEGWAFFIGDLLYPDPTRGMRITTTADNLFTLFVDGTPILGEDIDSTVWKGWKEVTPGPLIERKYRFACAVRNTAATGLNPGGWLLAAMYNDGAGEIEDIALTSNHNWRGFYSPSTWPGWTAGQIILRLINEANARNVQFGDYTFDFTDTAGSDGQPWTVTIDSVPTVHIPWFSMSHGSSYLEALDKLHQDGWVHWRMACGGLQLRMWSYDSPLHDSGAVFAVGDNITSMEREGRAGYANALLVAYEDGFKVVEDLVAIEADGRHEDVLSSDATSIEEAQRIGGHELVRRAADVEGGSVVMGIEPSDVPNRTGTPAYSDVPYVSIHVGDSVRIPALDGVGDSNPTYPGTRLVQVMSITVKQDGMGDPEFILELNRRWPVERRDTNRLLRSIGGKSLGQVGTRGVVT